jgi:hypothetical protein
MVNINIEVNPEWNEKQFEEFLDSLRGAKGMLTYPTDYALYVEIDTSYDGTQPPFEPIRDWVVRNITEGAITASEAEYNSIDDIAWAIVNHIAENGTDGVYFVTFTKTRIALNWDEIIGNYDGEVDAPEQIVKDLLDEMLEYSTDKLEQEEKIDTGNLIDSGVTIYGILPDSDDTLDVDRL